MTTKNSALVFIGLLLALGGVWLVRAGGNGQTATMQAETALVSAAEFKSKLQTTPQAVILDVRTPSEFAAGHIPNAVNLDFKNPDFAIEIKKLDPRTPYFVYCQSGNRSGQAVTKMKQAGIATITELRGGIAAAPELLTLDSTAAVPTTKSIAIDIGASSSENVAFAATESALSDDERAGLLYMREEEKLAHDVYLTLGAQWNLPIFTNIAASEQTHTDAVRALLDQYEITDPVTSSAVGVFVNPALQTLYTNLVTTGGKSLTDALTVGATIEDLDIHDLETRIAETNNADIKMVYENLMKGSRNHLRSFYSQLLSRDGSYSAEYITAAEFAQIVSSARETGGSGMGRGAGSH